MSSRNWPQQFHPFRLIAQSYDLRQVDLLRAEPVSDSKFNANTEMANESFRNLATEAILYGFPASLQYQNLYKNILAPNALHNFGQWNHAREVASPHYDEFRTPNVDTLYSMAWLDLSSGPVKLTVPKMGDRYYTVSLFDAHSNAVNLSSRTLGPDGGTVWLMSSANIGDSASTELTLRLATPQVWALMRIYVKANTPEELAIVHHLQDSVTFENQYEISAADKLKWLVPPINEQGLNGTSVLSILDTIIRKNGYPIQEEALLARFRTLGIGNDTPLQETDWSAKDRELIEESYHRALAAIEAVLTTRGKAVDKSWRALSSGAYGYNYLQRAATNFVGLGGTTRDESGPYTAHVDSNGIILDGSRSEYRLAFRPPPVDAFWSITVYDSHSRGLVPNEVDRYAVNSRSFKEHVEDDGLVHLNFSVADSEKDGTWLPIPPCPFYLVVRAYLGGPSVIDGSWAPGDIQAINPKRANIVQ